MKEGDTALVALPQMDGGNKIRPVLLLRQLPAPYYDFLVCGISSQTHQMIKNFDDIIAERDDDFKKSGIVKESIIRLSFLAVIPRNFIAGTIGSISEERHQRVLHRLSDYLVKR
ncbi:MAG: type II toxin-antitoxin system PemK/MazF family toxin [Ignavibacteriales bacterium]|nr:type II toxin-antitoxin system PemK/MazF family toxin [Ignavibacteriales bacterium]